MTLPEQSAILLEAIEDDLLQPEDIARWAGSVILAMEKPPAWVIELSTLRSPHLIDFVHPLREAAASVMLPIRRQIQIIVLAYNGGLISLPTTLSKLFRVTVLDRKGRQLTAPEEGIRHALIDWDCSENLDVIAPPLEAKLTALFPDFLTDADDIAAVLPWKFKPTS